jgi:hypothetical protein
MDQQFLLIIMAVFVAVAAIALVIQVGFLFGMYKAARAVQDSVSKLTPKVDAIAETSLTILNESRTQIGQITTKTNEILEITKRQLETIEGLLGDAATRARSQMDRAEMVVDDAMDRAQSTVAAFHTGIMKPIREINAVATGIRTAIQFLMRAGRPNPDQVTADEEMFI